VAPVEHASQVVAGSHLADALNRYLQRLRQRVRPEVLLDALHELAGSAPQVEVQRQQQHGDAERELQVARRRHEQ
jgi:hypothetical protein